MPNGKTTYEIDSDNLAWGLSGHLHVDSAVKHASGKLLHLHSRCTCAAPGQCPKVRAGTCVQRELCSPPAPAGGRRLRTWPAHPARSPRPRSRWTSRACLATTATPACMRGSNGVRAGTSNALSASLPMQNWRYRILVAPLAPNPCGIGMRSNAGCKSGCLPSHMAH